MLSSQHQSRIITPQTTLLVIISPCKTLTLTGFAFVYHKKESSIFLSDWLKSSQWIIKLHKTNEDAN